MDFFRKIPIVFVIVIVVIIAIVLFISEEWAKILSVDAFRNQYRIYLGPGFLVVLFFLIARVIDSIFKKYHKSQEFKSRQQILHELTPEEKGYLIGYIQDQQNSIYVGLNDGVMAGLVLKGIVYRASNQGDTANGFAFNLQPWATAYLTKNQYLLKGSVGRPMTPREKLHRGWR